MKNMLPVRIILIAVGLLGIANTLIISGVSRLNLGVLMPAMVGAPLLICGMIWPLLDNGIWRLLRCAFLVCYAVLFAAFSITWLIIDINAKKGRAEDADVIIVLGAGLRGETPTLVLQRRLNTAIEYLEANEGAIAILSGGKGEGELISEAEAMARYLNNRGIDESRYIKEDRSTSTRENFLFSNEIIVERFKNGAKIAFITTDFHVLRAGLTARRQGIETHGIAAPDVWFISPNNHMRECVALWAYAVTGNI